MSTPSVSLHPYFKAHPGHLEAARALLPKFVEKTSSEEGVIYYEFTAEGDVIFCREAYRDGEAALAHLGNVEALLKEMLTHTDLIRLELHGPAAELEKLKGPLKDLPAAYFELLDRLER